MRLPRLLVIVSTKMHLNTRCKQGLNLPCVHIQYSMKKNAQGAEHLRCSFECRAICMVLLHTVLHVCSKNSDWQNLLMESEMWSIWLAF